MPQLPSQALAEFAAEPTKPITDPLRRVTPEVSPVSIEPGVDAIGHALDTQAKANGTVYAANQMATMRVQTAQLLAQAKENAPPDGTDFTPTVMKAFDAQAGKVQADAGRNPYAQQALGAGLTQLRSQVAEHAINWEAQTGVQYRAQSLKDNIDKLSGVVEADPSQWQSAGQEQIHAIQNSNLDPETRLNIGRYLNDTLTKSAATGMARQDPQGVLNKINDPKDADPVISTLHPAEREALRQFATTKVASSLADPIVDTYRSQGPTAGAAALKSIDTSGQPDDIKKAIYSNVEQGLSQWHQEARQTNAPAIIGLETRLASSKTTPGDIGTVWSLYHSGAFTADQTGETIGRIQKAQEKQVGDEAWNNYALKAYTQHIALDPKDKDARGAIDNVFTSQTKGLAPGSIEWINRGADIASRTGVTPDSMIDWSRTQLVSADPKAAAAAAQTIERVQEANPRGTPFALDDKDKALARLVNDAVVAGTDPATAVTNARQIQAMPDAEKLRLEQIYNKKQYVDTAEGALRTELKNQPEYKGGLFTSLPPLPITMTGQFEELRANYFKLTGGNKDQAADLAMRDLKNTWGITEVNGKREFMQYAPEAHSGIPTPVLRNDMEASVKGFTPDPTKVRLVPTPDTASTNGQAWALGVPDKFGAYDVVRDAQHNPIPYVLPDPAKALAAQRQKEADAGMAKLKAAQALELDREKNELGEIKSQGRQMGAF